MQQRIDAIRRSFGQTFEALRLVQNARLVQPVLVLLYSGIDAAAALERPAPHADVTAAEFQKWVSTYMLPDRRLSCTALELYAARCGALHTFSGASRLSRAGKARTLGYAWGTGTVAALETVMVATGRSDMVAVQLEHLVEAFSDGFERFMADVSADNARLDTVLANAATLFGHIPQLPLGQ